MTKLSRAELLRELRGFFSDHREVRFAYLFGSLAKGTRNALSDVDIAVFLDNEALTSQAYPYGYRAYLSTELMNHLREKQVDVVILNQATPLLRFQVVRYGLPVYEVDHQERIRFHANVFSRYFDLLPLLKAHLSRQIFA
jgi:predicted nucleotidyltransferase